jgi:hypothetical protein
MKKGKQPASTTTASGSSVSATAYPEHSTLEYEEIMVFDTPLRSQEPSGAEGYSAASQEPYPENEGQGAGVKRKKAVQSEKSITMHGPMEVCGTVKSGGAITFNGDFSIGDRIEAYGNIDLKGSLTCRYV